MSKEDKTLYVHRPVINAAQLIARAGEEGFTSTLPPEDLHFTLCHSNTPLDWSKAGEALANFLRCIELPEATRPR